jgi:opacity protein-like surface antigen
MIFSTAALADDFTLQNVDSTQLKSMVGDLSTNFLHTSVSGASTLGHVFGFEVGVVGASTNTAHINDVVRETDPNASVDHVYNANILGVLTVPLGITAEIGFLPPVGSSKFHFNTQSLAVKWTPTEFLLDWPLSVALKASYTGSNLKIDQEVSGNDIHYKYNNRETALMALVSKNFVIVEPYFGLGLVQARGKLSADSSTVFADNVTSMEATRSGTAWMLGAELKLLVVKLGVEYTNLFNTGRVAGKLSVYF